MKTLHGVQTLDQSHGGLAVAVADLCSHLGEASIVERMTGRNRVLVSAPVIALDAAADFELIHQHGLWTRAISYEAPMVISPHGMLEPWALNNHRWRKKIGWWVFQRRILERAVAFHATSEMEARHIRDLGFRQPIAVLPNGVSSGWDEKFREPAETRTAVFLSRLDKKKGLPLLIEAWAKVRPEGWRLQIFGDGPSCDISDHDISFHGAVDGRAGGDGWRTCHFKSGIGRDERFGSWRNLRRKPSRENSGAIVVRLK